MTKRCGSACVLLDYFLAVAIVLPLYSMLSKSLENKAGDFVGLSNYQDYFSTPALFNQHSTVF